MTEFSLELSVDRQHLHDAVKGLMCTIFFYRTFGPIVPKTHEFLDIVYPFVELPELEDIIETKIDSLISKIDSDHGTPIFSPSSSTPLGSPPSLKYINPSTSNNPYSNIRFNDQSIEEDGDSEDGNHNSGNNNNSQTLDPSASGLLGSIHSSISPSLKPATNINSNVKFTQIVINFNETKKLKKPTWFGKIEEEIIFETWLLNIRIIQRPMEDNLTALATNFENLIWKISNFADKYKDHIPIITSTELLPFNYTISIKSNGNNESWKEFIKKMLKEPIL